MSDHSEDIPRDLAAPAAAAPVDDVVEEPTGDLPRVETRTEAKAILEALLFTTNQSLSTRRLAAMLPGWSERQVLDLLLELQAECDDAGRGLMVQEVAGGWIMATRPRWADWVFSLHRTRRRNPLSPQALETLAIIAYKQPITRADIEVIRGVDSGGMLRNLLDLDLIEVSGHRETIGRPPLYGTTNLFLRTFGLKSLSDLPSVEELVRLMPKEKGQEPGTAESAEDVEEFEETSQDREEGEEEEELEEEEEEEEEEDWEDEEEDDEDEDWEGNDKN
jgi:segregation and condensation protein B